MSLERSLQDRLEPARAARAGGSTLKAWAEELGMRDAAELLDETLQEEKRTDALLTKIAEERVNQRAA
jgi:ferritin-like metal-binding protein YciE